MSRSSSLVSIRSKSGSRLRVTTGSNVMAGHSSKFTLNRFPFPEKADLPVGIGGENRATNGRDSINLWNLEGRPWQRGRCNVRSTCISNSDQITFAKNRKVYRLLDDGHAIHVMWNDASQATIGRRVVSMPCHFPISLISFLFFFSVINSDQWRGVACERKWNEPTRLRRTKHRKLTTVFRFSGLTTNEIPSFHLREWPAINDGKPKALQRSDSINSLHRNLRLLVLSQAIQTRKFRCVLAIYIDRDIDRCSLHRSTTTLQISWKSRCRRFGRKQT